MPQLTLGIIGGGHPQPTLSSFTKDDAARQNHVGAPLASIHGSRVFPKLADWRGHNDMDAKEKHGHTQLAVVLAQWSNKNNISDSEIHLNKKSSEN